MPNRIQVYERVEPTLSRTQNPADLDMRIVRIDNKKMATKKFGRPALAASGDSISSDEPTSLHPGHPVLPRKLSQKTILSV